MLSIYSFCVNFVQENTYLLVSNGEAAIIDCGASSPKEWEQIVRKIDELGVQLTQFWLTHAHFDHVLGANFVQATYGLLPSLHTDDVPLYEGFTEQLRMIAGITTDMTLPPIGKTLQEGDVLTLGDTSWKVIHTPGHTRGGVCFYCEAEKTLITGDSLFRHCIGRTDLPGGNEASLIESLRQKVLTLPEEVVVFPGHDETTTILEERTHNIYLS